MLIDKPLNATCLFEDEKTKIQIDYIFRTINQLIEANRLYESHRDEQSSADGAVTVCLSGAWGTGKSSYLRGLQKKFEETGSKSHFFEAWRYSEEPDIFLALLEELYEILEHQDAKKILGSLIKSIGVATLVGVDALLKASLRVGIEDVEKGFKVVEERIRSVTRTRANYERFKKVLEELGSPERPFVLLVDDLDRLVPKKAYHLLERLRFYFSGPNVVIIMAINDEVINRYVHQHHEIEDLTQLNEAFIDKIFHYRFELSYSPLNALHLRSLKKCLEGFLKDKERDLEMVLTQLEDLLMADELRLPHRKWINVLNRIEAELLTYEQLEDIASVLKTLAPLALLKELIPEFNYLYRKHEDALIDINSPHVEGLKKELEKMGKSHEKELLELFMEELTTPPEQGL